MKNKKIKKIRQNLITKTAELAVFSILILFSGCTPELVDELDIKIVTDGAGFDGYYNTDGGSLKTFQKDISPDGFAIFEETVKIKDTLVIKVNTIPGATALDIDVYRDGVLVKNTSKTDLTEPVTETLKYVYNEEEIPAE